MGTESRPRDEAYILRWPEKPESPEAGELDPQQYAAVRNAQELFVGMANIPEEPAREKSELDNFLPRLDAHRRNHTVLIDGSRGSGKTCVMLRLLHDWSAKLKGTELPMELRKPADGVAIVPVGLLDLESVPKSANLATRLAGMFERVVGAMERRGVDRAHAATVAPWMPLDRDELASRAAWRKFVKAAALEWDRSLERRRANIDPEAYAVEAEQAEQAGAHARDQFRELIDRLIEDWQRWRPAEKRPFFVVPIDDADLAPDRVVELFELMRTLWHPRVGYLLTGDSVLFEPVLATDFGKAVAPAHAEPLARDLFHKAIPLAQRLRLGPLGGNERLAAVRSALLMRQDSALNAGAQYLGVDDFSARALPGRWRRLRDLSALISQGGFDGQVGLQKLSVKLWNDALNDSTLAQPESDSLRKVVEHDERDRSLKFGCRPHPDTFFRGLRSSFGVMSTMLAST